ncbi:MAG: hypothetical protein KVP17_002107 [Porospora cf. gigantea B]|uniref:uncharacterized protein n=1 Tax=Porospora cf. gigantea B TaxID=2853592 RepID=UPI003571A452|nr:MAG: hypothetical protein KVP17_002107 [Porospora cf. gigantea B]
MPETETMLPSVLRVLTASISGTGPEALVRGEGVLEAFDCFGFSTWTPEMLRLGRAGALLRFFRKPFDGAELLPSALLFLGARVCFGRFLSRDFFRLGGRLGRPIGVSVTFRGSSASGSASFSFVGLWAGETELRVGTDSSLGSAALPGASPATGRLTSLLFFLTVMELRSGLSAFERLEDGEELLSSVFFWEGDREGILLELRSVELDLIASPSDADDEAPVAFLKIVCFLVCEAAVVCFLVGGS